MATFVLTPLESARSFYTTDREHILIGLSPWNGRYKPHYIKALVAWAARHFRALNIFVPGYESAHTLTAAGCDPAVAVRRARRVSNQLRNPARRVLAELGIDPDQHIHSWTQLRNRSAYLAALQDARRAYAHDPVVRRACRETTRVAVRTVSGAEPSDGQIDMGVGFAVAELPLVLNAPAIFGVSSSVFIYHREMELITECLAGPTTLTPAPGQYYAIATWIDEPETEHETHRNPVECQARS